MNWPQEATYETYYDDGSGPEYQVKYTAKEGTAELSDGVDSITVPTSQLRWFIERLTSVEEIWIANAEGRT